MVRPAIAAVAQPHQGIEPESSGMAVVEQAEMPNLFATVIRWLKQHRRPLGAGLIFKRSADRGRCAKLVIANADSQHLGGHGRHALQHTLPLVGRVATLEP